MTPEELKPFHEQLQEGLKPDQICIREGVVLTINEKSRFPFEFFCWRSPEMVKEMDEFIKYAKGKRRLLDIGAHHGLFSLVFTSINKTGKAMAFEPSPDPYQILFDNCNNSQISCKPVALSEKTGRLEMVYEWDHLIVGEAEKDKTIDVPTFTGDEICSHSFPPDVIKIDVEGHEWKVLKGLKTTITTKHPIIFLELHPQRLEQQGDSLHDIIEFFEELEYVAIDTETGEGISWPNIESIKDKDLRLVLQ